MCMAAVLFKAWPVRFSQLVECSSMDNSKRADNPQESYILLQKEHSVLTIAYSCMIISS